MHYYFPSYVLSNLFIAIIRRVFDSPHIIKKLLSFKCKLGG